MTLATFSGHSLPRVWEALREFQLCCRLAPSLRSEHSDANSLQRCQLPPTRRFESEEAFFAAASANAACYFKAERHIVLEEPDLLQKDATVFSFRQRGDTTEHLADNTGGAIYDAAILLGRSDLFT